MHDLIAFFQTNAALVIGNPITFATFSVLFGSGGFVAGRYFLTERIANLESRIIRRDEEIAALKTGGREKAEEPSLIPIIGTSVIESDATPLLGKWPDRRQSGKLSAPPRQRRA
ncbi:hypothetical protein FJ872_13090 [Mesorhizobium sp. B2-5-9]|uniref:hypothetical protein n=1 Tax=Mesorhizobium sp. B2-5-9 TaxID=2589921 RepID=UPI00112BCE52|nr:hypothetical protein [Mesorhizobium sp. B2-5-9]TPK19668.1 hypothetical protein FJ872_13090 [Mesorhizobium sp. B2-5-9]